MSKASNERSKERRTLARQQRAIKKSNPKPGLITTTNEVAEVNGRDGRDCPNFGYLLSCGSSHAEAHAEMMRRARIKV